MSTVTISTLELRFEEDVPFIMKVVRKYAELAGVSNQNITKFITALSEMCRNAFQYAKGGEVRLYLQHKQGAQYLMADVIDAGGGIKNVDDILEGNYKSSTGMGLGIKGSKKLVDVFSLDTNSKKTIIRLGILLPHNGQQFKETDIKDWKAKVEDSTYTPVQELKKEKKELAIAYQTISAKEKSLAEANAKMARYVKLLKRKNEELSEFAHIVAHDLKSPLNVIFMAVEMAMMMHEEEMDDDLKGLVNKVQSSASKMLKLIDDMLEYAATSAKEDVSSEIDLNEVLVEVAELISLPEDVRLEPEELPTVVYDRMAIQQVFQNFITNAIKYNDKELTVIKIAARKQGNELVLSFSDNGPGIEPEFHEKIFGLFQTLGKKSKGESGTGIGLPLIKKIAERNNGRVWLESTVGEGTTFYFSIANSK